MPLVVLLLILYQLAILSPASLMVHTALDETPDAATRTYRAFTHGCRDTG